MSDLSPIDYLTDPSLPFIFPSERYRLWFYPEEWATLRHAVLTKYHGQCQGRGGRCPDVGEVVHYCGMHHPVDAQPPLESFLLLCQTCHHILVVQLLLRYRERYQAEQGPDRTFPTNPLEPLERFLAAHPEYAADCRWQMVDGLLERQATTAALVAFNQWGFEEEELSIQALEDCLRCLQQWPER